MRSKLICSILLMCIFNFCKAQDATIVLDTSMFDVNFQFIPITGFDGWIFKNGNDINWAKKEIDTTGWAQFNPTQLSVNNTDKKGRAEGWFRLRFRLNSSFQNKPVGILLFRWAATDVYIDGKHILSGGNTGLNGQPYEENWEFMAPPVFVDLAPGSDHILAFHFVDYVSPSKPSLLKTEATKYYTGGFPMCVMLTGTENLNKRIHFQRQMSYYWSTWFSVCALLSLVFWFLFFQNRSEKNLLLIAIAATFFSVGMFCDASMSTGLDLTFNSFSTCFYLKSPFYALSTASGFLFLAYVFQRKISFPFILVVTIYTLLNATNEFYFQGKLVLAIGILFLLTNGWLIVPVWRNLKGAQWALVIGILLTAISNVLYSYTFAKYQPVFPFPHAFLYLTGLFLSFPLSQMVYVVIRFKEILNEVRDNANEVVKITEEKKEILARQNELLELQVEQRTKELKVSQAQLIQSEKMASLGELTAGIAHEIQNPLNFVNNFSEVNKELISELVEEVDKKNYEEVKFIANDIKENEEKIIHHGKRADAIVKGMLQHSRTSTGKKEPTDINALADEYLRLSYHGLRAKDKSFNADFKTDFDESIGKMNIVPQDIGRVLLNLYNNAFYAVNEKQKAESLTQNAEYKPTVSVQTKHINSPSGDGGKVEIIVTDNGIGIPQKAVDKIFQPFFTTKPTGQGTGLGLSLSYDIIKAHGGEIRVESKEGEGSEFIIELPLNKVS